jgi:restriction system protein
MLAVPTGVGWLCNRQQQARWEAVRAQGLRYGLHGLDALHHAAPRTSSSNLMPGYPQRSVPFTSECPVESPVGGGTKLGAWTARRSIPSENYPAVPV